MPTWPLLGAALLVAACSTSPTTAEPSTSLAATSSSADPTTTAMERSTTAPDTIATPATEGESSDRFIVNGHSMDPTLTEGDVMIVDEDAYQTTSPLLADIVVFRLVVNGQEQTHVKRVVGLPGQTLSIDHCVVTIDGAVLAEPYVMPDESCGEDVAAVAIPSNSVFVMGDNRCCSRDSRGFGPILLADISGHVVAASAPDGTARNL